jgi:hypothetical protein
MRTPTKDFGLWSVYIPENVATRKAKETPLSIISLRPLYMEKI